MVKAWWGTVDWAFLGPAGFLTVQRYKDNRIADKPTKHLLTSKTCLNILAMTCHSELITNGPLVYHRKNGAVAGVLSKEERGHRRKERGRGRDGHR